ncbi:glycosyltransferase family 39 protein [Roseomonas frigidaquae]|uniref:Glycosyltransferase family 39 protein n=1 Tax=Falsiroseomonas frigidaquae TaxID=487318 RepID=A0ABX1EX96_9PROT|nr:glycosyltransferase family 39 protein [Falsiroseomonas frigidaquae]NKE44708.1 glycosyltransferase family 39 protein [Falsiroseomonas frigidaquae]
MQALRNFLSRDFLDRLPETRRPLPWLALLCLLLWLPGFFSIPAGDRDESRFAQASRQMVETGDLVRIRFGEVERNKKPAGIHWLQAGSVRVVEALRLGDRNDIWAYRIPSLAGALLAVLATAQLGRALVGRRAAFLGAAMLAGCFVLGVETHIAKTDAALLGTIVVAMGLMGRAYVHPNGFGAGAAASFWLVLGVSILLKGPIGPLVAGLAALTLAMADRAWTAGAPWLRVLRPGWGVPLMVLAAAPWFIAVTIATEGRFLTEALGGDMLGKVGGADENHWGPPGYYLLSFGIAAFPAAFLVLRAAPGVWADRLQPGTRFLLAWAVPAWLMFEAVTTKLPHYVLPTYPALMLLAAAWALDPLRQAPPRWLALLATVGAIATATGLGLAAAVLPVLADGAVDPLSLLGLPAAAIFAWGLLRMLREGAPARAALLAVLLAVPLQAVALGLVLPRLEAPWISPRLAEAVRQAAPGLPDERFGVVGYHEPSLLFALGGEIRLLRDGAAAAEFLAGEPGRLVAVADRQQAPFRAEAAARALAVTERGTVSGFNYSRGRRVAITLYGTDR